MTRIGKTDRIRAMLRSIRASFDQIAPQAVLQAR